MSDFDLGTSDQFKLELEEVLDEHGYSFKNNNLIDSMTYKIKLRGKQKDDNDDEDDDEEHDRKREFKTDFLLSLEKKGFRFFMTQDWLIIF